MISRNVTPRNARRHAEGVAQRDAWRALGLESRYFLERLACDQLMRALPLDAQGDREITERENPASRFLLRRLVDALGPNFLPGYRLEPRLSAAEKSIQRHFRKRGKRLLSAYRQYYRRLDGLPHDPVDVEVRLLGQRFGLANRALEFFPSMDALVASVLELDGDDGENEPLLRVLQSDFLATLAPWLDRYTRFEAQKRRAFALQHDELIRSFSYFEQSNAEARRRGEPPDEAAFDAFSDDVEERLEAAEKPGEAGRVERLLRVDHQARIAEWAHLKKTALHDGIDPAVQLEALREVLIQAPEWRQALSIFRSELNVQRLADGRFAQSGMEDDAILEFVGQMVERVDEELPTDVIFRGVEQDLVRSGENAEALRLVRSQIALELRRRGEDSPTNIVNLKRRFSESVMASQGPAGGVRPLFGRGPADRSPASGRRDRR